MSRLVCFDCAKKENQDYAAALEIESELRLRILSGKIVKCDICGEIKSIWKKK